MNSAQPVKSNAGKSKKKVLWRRIRPRAKDKRAHLMRIVHHARNEGQIVGKVLPQSMMAK